MSVVYSPSIVLKSEETSDGQYKITQLQPPSEVSSQAANSSGRKEIHVNIEIFEITGYYDPDIEEIGIKPTILGIPGTWYYGGLKTGLGFDCELIAGRGRININRDGDDIVFKASFKGRWFIGDSEVSQKLFTL